jgi:hypothetical protein
MVADYQRRKHQGRMNARVNVRLTPLALQQSTPSLGQVSPNFREQLAGSERLRHMESAKWY